MNLYTAQRGFNDSEHDVLSYRRGSKKWIHILPIWPADAVVNISGHEWEQTQCSGTSEVEYQPDGSLSH